MQAYLLLQLRLWLMRLDASVLFLLDSLLALWLSLHRRLHRRPLRSPVALIVRLGDLSDVLLWLPAGQRLIPSLRQKGYRVLLVVPAGVEPLLQDIGDEAEIIPVDGTAWRHSWRYRWAFAGKLADIRADLALETSYSRTLLGGDSMVRFSAAKKRVGWVGDARKTTRTGHRLGRRVYTTLLPNPPKDPLPETESQERLLAQLGVPLDPAGPSPFPSEMLQPSADMGLPDRYVILAPGAASPLQRWPASSFATVVDAIHKHYALPVLVCGGQEDAPHAAMIMALSTSAITADLCGKISLADLPALVARADLVIGNEGPLIHLAAMVATPSLCLTSGTLWGRTLPYGRSRLLPGRIAPIPVTHPMDCYDCAGRCIYTLTADEPAPCVSAITAAQVIGALADFLPQRTA